MLAEQRYEKILKNLEQNKSVTVAELTKLLNTSESTIRRDLNALDKAGKLVKVFGGAVSAGLEIVSEEPSVEQKEKLCYEEKQSIGRYAASLVKPGDFIYLDAGTTTGAMIGFLEEKGITVVTNAVGHARSLAASGIRVLLIGGELKGRTVAVVGSQAVAGIQKYQFTKGFFGTNGASRQGGYSTPDEEEAVVKETAFSRCQKRYVLCDHTKFGHTSLVSFGELEEGILLTDSEADGTLEGCTEIRRITGNWEG